MLTLYPLGIKKTSSSSHIFPFYSQYLWLSSVFHHIFARLERSQKLSAGLLGVGRIPRGFYGPKYMEHPPFIDSRSFQWERSGNSRFSISILVYLKCILWNTCQALPRFGSGATKAAFLDFGNIGGFRLQILMGLSLQRRPRLLLEIFY